VLQQYFGETRLSEALTNVLVTGYEIEERRPFFFKSHNAKQDKADDFLMREAARATSAAPTYFEPARVPAGIAKGYQALVDGGVYANNPAMCSYVRRRAGARAHRAALAGHWRGRAADPHKSVKDQ
jgi:patatin-like phospholipase/acyl hydrolase